MLFSSLLHLFVTCIVTSFMLDVITCDYRVKLQHMNTLKIPAYTEQGERLFRFGSGSVNKISYDPFTRLLYVVGGPDLHYVNVTRDGMLKLIGHTSLPDVTFHDVTTCGEMVMATYTQFNESGMMVARHYHPSRGLPVVALAILYDQPEPVSLSVTSDCRTAVVAISGKASWDGKELVDGQAAVLIVPLPTWLDTETITKEKVTVLDFKQFDDSAEELAKQGIRFPMKGRTGRLSQDLEPSDVTIDDVFRKAYVTLKVNNAVAEVDLDTVNITSLTSLGLKDWREMDIDSSDMNGVKFQQFPIYSLYQPDAICILRHSGATYLLTANTGAMRDYSHIIHWSEAMTGSELVKKNLIGTAVSKQLKSALNNQSQLGSVYFTKIHDGEEVNENKMTKFVTFGGRSFSIRALPDLDLVYDSGSDVEQRMASEASEIFNCPVKDGHSIVRYDRDKASILSGPEPISIMFGQLVSLSLVFVGLANPGGLLLYSLPLNSQRARFESLWLGLSDPLKSWDELYMETGLGGIVVSDISFIPGHQTGSGHPWVIVAGAKSGTVSILNVHGTGDIPDFASKADAPKYSRLTALAIVPLLQILFFVFTAA